MRRARGTALVFAAVCGLGVSSPIGGLPAAHAQGGVTYHAAPNGSGTDCTLAQPCDVVTGAATTPNDGVLILEPGSYGTADDPITQTIANSFDGGVYRNITVEGEAGKPLPVIHTSADYGVLLRNSFIERVDIEHTGTTGGLELSDSAADRVRVDSSAFYACEPYNDTIEDSVCHDSAANGVAVLGQALGGENDNPDIINVTAVADGAGGKAIECMAQNNSKCNATIANTIAISTSYSLYTDAMQNSAAVIEGSNDLTGSRASLKDEPSTSSITLMKSSQKSPKLVNQSAGDYREQPDSPAVDAGLYVRGIKSLADLDGLPRDMGTAPDIGAYELPVPATVGKSHASGAGTPKIKVKAIVSTQGLPGTALLEAKHGHDVKKGPSKKIPAKSGKQKLTVKVKHLSAGTHYDLTVVIKDAGGTTKQPVH